MKTLDHVNDPIHLMDIAIRDVREFKRRAKTNNKLVFNVHVWHDITKTGVCHACVAGAVMSGELEVPDDQEARLTHFPSATRARLEFLDNIRMGRFIGNPLFPDREWLNPLMLVMEDSPADLMQSLNAGNVAAWEKLRDKVVETADELDLEYVRLEE